MKLIPTIGIEMHCEMKSQSKVFSKARNTFSEESNIHVAPLDIALPGALPTLNKECVRKAIMAALILNCKIPEYLYFDRKNYYYPDLPKGYQVTQSHDPIGTNGTILVPMKDKDLNVLIHDIHLEEDTAQLDHIKENTYINYNRSGVPLLELVTEPCFHSKEEVMAFLEYIRRVYQYADISDADATKGQIRCDVNISLSEDDTLGTKVEIKGIPFSNISSAIDYEIERQTKLIENGMKEQIEQETRRFDEESATTIHMRSKADAIDYKYFVEPNIPKIKIDIKWINKIAKEIPIMPKERLEKYTKEYNLSFIDANILLKEKKISDYFENCVQEGITPKIAFNWIAGPILGYLNKEYKSIQNLTLSPKDLKMVIDKITDGTISSKQAKEIIQKSLETSKKPNEFMDSENSQISDTNMLKELIKEIITNNPTQVEAYKNGKTNLFEFFVGQVMKQTKGKANPVKTREILQDILN